METARSEGRLAGKWALVTGSTKGLGQTTAVWLAREGANIVVHGMEEELITPAVAIMQQEGVEAWGMAADLARVEEMHRLGAAAVARVPHLDILINNAGGSRGSRGNFWDVSDAGADWTMNVNWRATFVLSQYAARQMIERGIHGRIVNISTIGAHYNHRDRLVYNAAKAAIEATTRNMAYELGPYGIAVNCVAPGNMAERPGAPRNEERWQEQAEQWIPLGRVGTAEDIAAAVRFFCLPESAYTTGQTLLVTGGYAMYLPGD
jgi:NAD(P)-dependent dehydrogenase (short-subunit alcohol dehydrogenase family)